MEFSAIKTIATGGMAEIATAVVRPGGRLVVVKHLLASLADNRGVGAQLIAEGERMRCLAEEPGVVDVLEVAHQGDDRFQGPYLVLEFVDGEQLSCLWGRGPVSMRLSATIIMKLAEILSSVHRAVSPTGERLALVHRDVCPENVLLTRLGRLVLIDFGVSSAAWPHAEVAANQGRAAYMAPEQARGGPLDGRADVYSLGVMSFEMLTGQRYYATPSRLAILGKLMDGYRVAPSECGFAGSSELDSIIVRALAPEHSERFECAADMAMALRGWLEDHGGPASLADLV